MQYSYRVLALPHYGTDVFTFMWEDSHQDKVDLNAEVMVIIIIIIIIINITVIPSCVQAKKN
jgi:hypothetical protein